MDMDKIEVQVCNNWTHVAYEIDFDPCPACGRYSWHNNSIIIAVDGACRGNGGPDARAAIGVYFGPSSKYNVSKLWPGDNPTNQIAELWAAIVALEKAIEVQRVGVHGEQVTRALRRVVIKADSEYVVKAMTEWVFKWERNGWRSTKGSAVVNEGLFKRLLELVKRLNSLEVEVLFWHVLRERNSDADELANQALERSFFQ